VIQAEAELTGAAPRAAPDPAEIRVAAADAAAAGPPPPADPPAAGALGGAPPPARAPPPAVRGRAGVPKRVATGKAESVPAGDLADMPTIAAVKTTKGTFYLAAWRFIHYYGLEPLYQKRFFSTCVLCVRPSSSSSKRSAGPAGGRRGGRAALAGRTRRAQGSGSSAGRAAARNRQEGSDEEQVSDKEETPAEEERPGPKVPQVPLFSIAECKAHGASRTHRNDVGDVVATPCARARVFFDWSPTVAFISSGGGHIAIEECRAMCIEALGKKEIAKQLGPANVKAFWDMHARLENGGTQTGDADGDEEEESEGEGEGGGEGERVEGGEGRDGAAVVPAGETRTFSLSFISLKFTQLLACTESMLVRAGSRWNVYMPPRLHLRPPRPSIYIFSSVYNPL
jgi:hypothetical protein